MAVQTLTISGKKFALIPFHEFESMKRRSVKVKRPELPNPLPDGTYPAEEAMRVIYARKLTEAREAAGLSQSELARQAGLRAETINRLEKARHTPDMATLAKIKKVITAAGKKF